MTEGKLLIIGGQTGIGEAAAKHINNIYPEVEQYVPLRGELDVTEREDIIFAIGNRGPFTHILYSAGVNRLKWMDGQALDVTLESAFAVNCSGFIMTLGEHRRKWPNAGFSAVAISSDAAHIPMRGSIAYCASKAALDMAVKVAARELAPFCRVNAIAPGMVEGTPMTRYIDRTIPEFRGWTEEQTRAYEKLNTPTQRRATLDEVSRTIMWVLFGPEQMTGAIIPINGGR
jgi:NAD(P)-dependent dehydrogenase (short-subunit alcohol dehydrogenase family)